MALTPWIAAIIARLVAQSVAPAARIYFSQGALLPDSRTAPAFLTLQTYSGAAPSGTLSEPIKYREPVLQVTARAATYELADTLARAAYEALSFENLTVSGVHFLRVRPQQEPFELPLDTAGRARVAFNISALLVG